MPAVVLIYAKYNINNYDIMIVSAHYGMDKFAYCFSALWHGQVRVLLLFLFTLSIVIKI